MKLREIVSSVVLDRRKFVEYALNPENLVGGGDKALVFQQRLGYTKDNYESLFEQIRDGVLEEEALPKLLNQHGQRYQVDLEVTGVEGQRAIVRTGWIVEPGATVARLVTLYVRKQP
jgi:hypothetical protein